MIQSRIRADPALAEQLAARPATSSRSRWRSCASSPAGSIPRCSTTACDAALKSLASRASVATSVSFESRRARCPSRSSSRPTSSPARRWPTSPSTRRRRTTTVRVSRRDGLAVIEIADDGVGGADESAGTGLEGLADRVAALDGTLRILSPPGGGTVVTAELPCES